MIGITRKTYLKHLKELVKKRHLEFDKPLNQKTPKTCFIVADTAMMLADSKSETSTDYLKIYFKHAEEIGVNISNYALLYLGYSIPRKNQNKVVRARNSFLINRIEIKEESLYKVKQKLADKGLIIRNSIGNFTIKEELQEWFKHQESIGIA